jgi:cytoskeletal protein CcmA (bactofilin family)
MWKRDDPSRPAGPAASAAPVAPQSSPASDDTDAARGEPRLRGEARASIGTSIVIKGELSGSEDLTIEGEVEGKIELREHVLTVGPSGRIRAHVAARSIIVLGQVTGDLTATDKVDIQAQGSVEGDIVAPRVAIADGATFRGSIDMQRKVSPPVGDRTAGGLQADAQPPALPGAELVRV